MHDEPASRAAAPARPSLLRNGAFSLVTSAAPLVVSLVALPVLTRVFGAESLGLLALAWAWLGYAALLDFGLGRALTRLVAAADAGAPLDAPIGAFVNTAHRMLVVVGALVGIAGALALPCHVTYVLGVSTELRTDALVSAMLFVLTVPAITGASAPRAVLEARHRFRDVNLVRLPVSIGSFAVPLLLLWFTVTRHGIVGAAAAWTFRVVLDAALLAWRAESVAPLSSATLLLGASGIAMVGASAWIGATENVASRTPLIAAGLMALAIPAALWSQRNSAERLVLERAGGSR